MGAIAFPRKQLNHKYINNAIDEWLDIHYGDTSFNGRVVIGHRKPGGGIYTMTARSLTSLRPYVKMIHASTRLDYYITANTVSGVNRRKSELFGLQNIVIDIDCHKEDSRFDVTSLVQAFIWRIKRDLWNTNIIPTPNSIVYTGRGVQLWWALVPCYGGKDYTRSLYHHNRIKNVFMNHIEAMLFEYEDELEGLSVDRGASSNLVGFFRMPCTYNTTARSYGSLEILHGNRYDQRDLTLIPDVDGEESDTSLPREQSYVPMTDSDRSILQNFQFAGVRRVIQLIKLRNLRDNEVGSEMRDHFNFSVYNALRITCDHATAMVELSKFNDGFKDPMTQRELNNCISTAIKKGGYKYTNSKLIELLEVTPEEQNIIGLFPFRRKVSAQPNASRDAARRALKEDRDNKITELSRKGVAQAEIARILGIGKNTVWRVLKRLREIVEGTKIEVSDEDSTRHHFGSIYVYTDYYGYTKVDRLRGGKFSLIRGGGDSRSEGRGLFTVDAEDTT